MRDFSAILRPYIDQVRSIFNKEESHVLNTPAVLRPRSRFNTPRMNLLFLMNETHDMKIFLKIKIKSLIAEQALILREERRIGDYDNPVRKQMRKHREIEIAEEIRLSLLAYGFLRGRRYRQLERTTHRPLTKDQVQRLAKMVARFGGGYGSSLDNMLGSWLGEPEDRAEIDRLRAEALARKEASRARWRSNKAS